MRLERSTTTANAAGGGDREERNRTSGYPPTYVGQTLTQPREQKLSRSPFSPAQHAHELVPALCDLLPLPSLLPSRPPLSFGEALASQLKRWPPQPDSRVPDRDRPRRWS